MTSEITKKQYIRTRNGETEKLNRKTRSAGNDLDCGRLDINTVVSETEFFDLP